MVKNKKQKRLETKRDINQIVEFYNPYPVCNGPEHNKDSFIFPKEIEAIIKRLNGKRLSLIEALKQIQVATRGRVEIISEHQCIILSIKVPDNHYYSFRLIRYKRVES